ncbi:CidA/LrgA family protein [Paenibacillus sp. RC67]|uniref:CidA/LrgA family protein n=1 Tax=Paenibacillus sp. RC67 TaxID=3039392 RepID=UPI0024ADEC25|nr:CidA/LrgA family protein [Paenibacillus sp. RC67]
MLGVTILVGFYFLGYVLHGAAHIPLPANVIGLILFTVCLFLKLVKLEWVEDAGEFLIKHMLLFFIPFVVGTMVFFHYIGVYAVQLLVSLFASTAGVLLVSGWTVKLMNRKGEKQSDSR